MTKYAAFGAKLQYNPTGLTTWSDLAGIRDIPGLDMSADTIDSTTHDSPGAFKEFIKTLLDAGEMPVELAFDPEDSGHNLMIERFLATSDDAFNNYRIVFNTAAARTWGFEACVTKFATGLPLEGLLTATATLKINGLPDFDV